MKTLVYKMTHSGDPHRDVGCWGVAKKDCMGRVRGFDFEAVIGIGGRSWYSKPNRAGEIVWIGKYPKWTPNDRSPFDGLKGPKVRFEHFLYFPEEGKKRILEKRAPRLYKAMRKRRFMMYGFSPKVQQEIERILKWAANAPPSAVLTAKMANSQGIPDKCCSRVSRVC